MKHIALIILLLLFGVAFVWAQESPERTKAMQAMEMQQDTLATSPQGPVAVPEPSEKAMRYYRSGNVLWVINVLWGLLVPAFFLFTGLSALIRDWVTRIGKKWFFILAAYFAIYMIFNYIIDWPLSYYQGYVRQHAYGLSNQTFNKWFGDSLKALLVGIITGSLFLWIPYLLLKKSPRRWWLYTSLAAIPVIFFVVMISPIWIAPLFNDFGPMKNKQLETKILALAEKAGIEGSRVYEVNKSVDTRAVNAYVTGFMGTKRIVLWDTIIEKLNEDELLFVMGHEMGHYVLGHVWKSVFFFSAFILVALYLAYRLTGGLIRRFQHKFGFSNLADIASLPLLILIFNVFMLVFSPILMGFSRYQEHEADRFGLEITQNNYAAAMAFVKLQQENLANPRPGWLYKLWRSSHPPLGERIEFCNTYRPWGEGMELKYGHLFRRSE
ncbi:MAG: M48 family metallopeptidase [candidate division KSB1 bacterium]|nr:M48 family metallopeptidase [candidate division KSB1 bacterium]MDQ7064880.1 M48 family metallopeptidase [candidate division KSB1 bacterium]